jgi:tetratricopeptide (TPR) repeat protein
MIAVSELTFARLLLSCRVTEAARVLQTVEDYSALLELVEKNVDLLQYQDPFFKQYLLEVRSRALLHLGQYDMAIAALEDCCRLMPSTNTDRIVAHLLLSQIYRQSGREDLAGETLNKLEEHLTAVEPLIRRLPILRQIAYRLALERHEMGDDEKALEPAEKAFKWCHDLNDQPGMIKAAILLLRVCSRSGSSMAAHRRWYEELRQLAATTFFRLERACAYWELGLLEHDGDLIVSREFLENSHELYRSVPFVDSRRSCKAVEQTLNLRVGRFQARTTTAWQNSPSIDSTFDALLEYVPHLTVC